MTVQDKLTLYTEQTRHALQNSVQQRMANENAQSQLFGLLLNNTLKAGNLRPYPILEFNFQHRALDHGKSEAARSIHAELGRKTIAYVNSPQEIHASDSGKDIRYQLKGRKEDIHIHEVVAIHHDLFAHLQDTYTIATGITNVPIYFIVRKKARDAFFDNLMDPNHLILFVFCNNILYSIGFGNVSGVVGTHSYTGQTVQFFKNYEMQKHRDARQTYETSMSEYEASGKQGIRPDSPDSPLLPGNVYTGNIITPDDTPYLRTSTGRPYDFEIIDVGFFTRVHASNLMRMVDYHMPDTITLADGKKKTIHWTARILFSDKNGYVYPVLHFQNLNKYAICALPTNVHYNCVTFIEAILPGRIFCMGTKIPYHEASACEKVGSYNMKTVVFLLLQLCNGLPVAQGDLLQLNQWFSETGEIPGNTMMRSMARKAMDTIGTPGLRMTYIKSAAKKSRRNEQHRQSRQSRRTRRTRRTRRNLQNQ